MGPLGVQEMIAIVVIALLLFGPKKLPELGRMVGKALSEFRRAKNELKTTFETQLQELEKETRSQPATTNRDYSPSYHPYHYDEYGPYNSDHQSSSGSHETHESNETGASESATASATATQDAEAHRDYSSSQTLPVAGTIPRSNGIQPAEAVSEATEEHHPV